MLDWNWTITFLLKAWRNLVNVHKCTLWNRWQFFIESNRFFSKVFLFRSRACAFGQCNPSNTSFFAVLCQRKFWYSNGKNSTRSDGIGLCVFRLNIMKRYFTRSDVNGFDGCRKLEKLRKRTFNDIK